MGHLMRIVAALALCVPLAGQAATLYLCKGYGGGTFWSSVTCSAKQATIERMITVPDDMPFEQQVAMGNQVVAEAQKLHAPPPAPVVVNQTQHYVNGRPVSECKAIEERIRHLDSMARQPQSGPTQDRIAAEKKELRDRQFRIRC